ncbi:peptide deformylase [Candidatus Daviesbacteria bacterium]|nr:peptide deformylase [Candidatus Daviesbacteria bacterium]
MQVVQAPDQKLRVKTKVVKKVNSGLKKLTEEMIKLTKSFQDPEGVGLAATQIGLGECFFVGKIGGDFKTFINPRIVSLGKKTKKYFEGCLSIPNYYGEINRSLSLKATYQDLQGQMHTESLKGVDAWIFQHEVDHLNGILFPDRVLEQKGKFYKFTGKDKTGRDMFEEVTI